jgi:hypothetical protein
MKCLASIYLEELYIRLTKNKMIQLIRTYLLQNKSISIPGLGTIYVERIPVQSDFVNKQLLPPSYHLRFDKYFDAPGKEFFTYVAARKKVEDYEAIKLYNEWALNLRNSIGNNQTATLEGVGSLKRDLSGDVVFEAEGELNTVSVTVPAERIVRTNTKHNMLVGDREYTNVEMNDYLNEVHREKVSWWIYALIVAAISFVAIFIHFYKTGSTAPFGNQQTIPIR